MFTLQHGADSSGKEFSFASWSISAEHKQGFVKQLTSFFSFFGNNVIYSQDQGYSFLGFRILNPECLF